MFKESEEADGMGTVVQRQPTSVTVCSLSSEHALRASNVFHKPWFRW